jgi:hypothetical protein
MASLLSIVAFLVAAVLAATPGSFRGTVVESDEARPESGWIYVKGRDGGIRRVDISHALIAYADDAGQEQSGEPRRDLVAGAEVRVTAEQGSDGEWRAKSVEILKKPERSSTSNKAGKS